MKRYSVLITKENAQYCLELNELFAASGHFEILPSIHDGRGAVESIMAAGPDILLLDSVLPSRDGLSILQELRRRGTGDMKIIILSPYVYDGFVELLLSLGVVLVVHMPMEPETVFRRVLDFAVSDESIRSGESEARRKEFIKRRDKVISNYFHALGMPVRLLGYRQAKSAVACCVENYGHGAVPLSEVYGRVAQSFQTSAKCVERNIRTAIDAAWERGNLEQQHALFGYTVYLSRGRPTNKEFISMIAERTAANLRYR